MLSFIRRHWVAYLIGFALALVLGFGAAIVVGVKGSTPVTSSMEEQSEETAADVNEVVDTGSSQQ